jgi:hypothetical protein
VMLADAVLRIDKEVGSFFSRSHDRQIVQGVSS